MLEEGDSGGTQARAQLRNVEVGRCGAAGDLHVPLGRRALHGCV